MSDTPILEMRHIGKAFPGVRALNDVSFDCRAGEVHALVGENGAGKSTLIKILSGVYTPDSGSVVINGAEVKFRHPLDALRAGLSVIYQEFSLLPERTVAQNLFLGREIRHGGFINERAQNAETRRVLALFGTRHKIAPDTVVADLDVASQQMVEIAKAVSLNAKVIVMDEPTAALNETECEVLFGLIEDLRKAGTAIIYITHRMREVTRLANRVTVLKDGEVAARFDSAPEPQAGGARHGRPRYRRLLPAAGNARGNRQSRARRQGGRQCLPQGHQGFEPEAPARSPALPGCRARGARRWRWRCSGPPVPPPAASRSTAHRRASASRAMRSAPASACCPATARPRACC